MWDCGLSDKIHDSTVSGRKVRHLRRRHLFLPNTSVVESIKRAALLVIEGKLPVSVPVRSVYWRRINQEPLKSPLISLIPLSYPNVVCLVGSHRAAIDAGSFSLPWAILCDYSRSLCALCGGRVADGRGEDLSLH